MANSVGESFYVPNDFSLLHKNVIIVYHITCSIQHTYNKVTLHLTGLGHYSAYNYM